MKMSALFKYSLACITLIVLPAIASENHPRYHQDIPGWIGAFLCGIDDGVKINGVIRDGPADQAGLRAGDVVFEAAGKSVRSPAQLTGIVRDTAVGNDIALRVRRSGDEKSMTVKVGKWPEWFSGSDPAWPGHGWPPTAPHGDWRLEWPPKSWMDSKAADHLQKQMDTLRKQMENLREKLEKHLSSKQTNPSHI